MLTLAFSSKHHCAVKALQSCLPVFNLYKLCESLNYVFYAVMYLLIYMHSSILRQAIPNLSMFCLRYEVHFLVQSVLCMSAPQNYNNSALLSSSASMTQIL